MSVYIIQEYNESLEVWERVGTDNFISCFNAEERKRALEKLVPEKLFRTVRT